MARLGQPELAEPLVKIQLMAKEALKEALKPFIFSPKSIALSALIERRRRGVRARAEQAPETPTALYVQRCLVMRIWY